MFEINAYQPISIIFSQPLKDLSLNSTLLEIQSLMDYFQIEISRSGEELYQVFKENLLLTGAILNKKDKFIGMISRHDFLETISRQYGRDIYLKRPLESLHSFVNREVLILPAHTLISKAVQQFVQRHSQSLYEPIVVKFHNESYKLLDTQQLLMAQTQIYKLCTETLAERNMALDQANLGITERNQQMLSYLQQVEKVTTAAAAVENNTYEPKHLSQVAARSDELGQLARVFQRMVQAVRTREQEVQAQLKHRLQELQIEIDQQKRNKEVAEIIQSDYFQELQEEAELLQFNDENW